MTRKAFDQWIEQHYGELVARARTLVNNPADAAEVIHQAVARAISNRKLGKVRNPWTWMVNSVRSAAYNQRVSDSRRAIATVIYASAVYRGQAQEKETEL